MKKEKNSICLILILTLVLGTLCLQTMPDLLGDSPDACSAAWRGRLEKQYAERVPFASEQAYLDASGGLGDLFFRSCPDAGSHRQPALGSDRLLSCKAAFWPYRCISSLEDCGGLVWEHLSSHIIIDYVHHQDGFKNLM